MWSSPADNTMYLVFGDIKFFNIFARGSPLARALNEIGYVPEAVFD